MHWLDKIVTLFEAETNDLKELARLTGLNPNYFYVGTNISGADIRGQDLRGMSFTDLDLSQVKYDDSTKLDYLEELDFINKIKELEVRTKIISINKMRRQEERAVFAIKLYLDNPMYINVIDEIYREKGKFSKSIIERFRSNHSVDLFSSEIGMHKFYNFIDHVINSSFPSNRGKLILYLAKYFGGDHMIAQLLRKRLVASNTMVPYFIETTNLLEEWEKDTWGAKLGLTR